MGENYDATWLPTLNEGSLRSARKSLREMEELYRSGGRFFPSDSIRPYSSGKKISYSDYGIPIASMMTKKEEKTPVNSTDQAEIDAAVREALAKPKREAEIAKRVAAVEAIGTEDTHEIGTVLKWDRKMQPGSKMKPYVYVAVKIGDDCWYVTGTTTIKIGAYKWEELLEWMITGSTLVENLQVAASWDTIL